MKKASEYDPGLRTAILIVGDPGTRKTSLCLNFPRPYVFDADNNLAGPVRHYDTVDFHFDNGHVASRDWTLPQANIKYKEGEVIKPPHRYLWMSTCLNEASQSPDVDTLVVDSLTSVADFVISEIKRQEHRKDDEPLRIQDWGKFLYLMKHLVTQLKTTDRLVLFTAHDVMEKDEADGTYKTFLAIPGQSKHTLAALFNDVWATYIKQSGPPNNRKYEYRIRTLPKGENDHRGLKDSLGLSKTFDWGVDEILTKLQKPT